MNWKMLIAALVIVAIAAGAVLELLNYLGSTHFLID